eukprot:15453150-Alexandrium_andersonii.AAC.1
MLHEQGWEWDEWVPVSRRTKLQKQALPLAYEVGAEQVWYSSSVHVSANYLRCLLSAEECWSKTVPY